jgi:hypothetical protein
MGNILTHKAGTKNSYVFTFSVETPRTLHSSNYKTLNYNFARNLVSHFKGGQNSQWKVKIAISNNSSLNRTVSSGL